MRSCVLVVCICLALSVCFSHAQTEVECKALVDKAAAMFTEQGREAALKAIDDPKGPFVKGELYVFALTMDNVLVGHPHDKKLKQLNMTNIKDGNGEFCFKKFHEIASKDGSGWVNYTWTKPGEKDASPKKSYILKVPDADMYIGAGYYIK